ncbi:MAG TPA: 4Fe-4S binding protein [Ottowia sp.]|uniref:ATP-binding protein n=1 Tax=Ottowia sp. TaxID=1898956 RepID=UPI002BB60CC9|nr:4Fe-4S binding protein [Ottowia sp.]HMN21920.1 4Fe-4S binding protein [Ottowia sp.]
MKRLARALPEIDRDRCTGCGWCVAACPPHVLSLHLLDGRKSSALDDAAGCTGCALCAVRCPFDAITMKRISNSGPMVAALATG